MRKNRSPDEALDTLFAQPDFWRGCAAADLELAEKTDNDVESKWLKRRANAHLTLAENPNARNQADLRYW